MDEVVEEAFIKAISIAVTSLPKDVEEALRKAFAKEDDPIARRQLDLILKNVEYSRKNGIPICQDTGILHFYLKVGERFPIKSRLRDIVVKATRRATVKIPLRPNSVNIITGVNSGDNTGLNIPCIHWELVKGDELEAVILPKGAGSENMSRLFILRPEDGIKAVKEVVLRSVVEAGGRVCPPTIVGVGLGGGSDIALSLAKKALIRPIDIRNKIPEIAELERELTRLINELGIGVMGLGGKTTTLGVNIEVADRHPANLPVGIIFQCWAARKCSLKVNSRGLVEFL